MTRQEFLTVIAGRAVSVKAVAETLPDGSAPLKKRLLVIQIEEHISMDHKEYIHSELHYYEEKYGVEFLLLTGGLK